MKVLDLFSGIGGFSLGLERAGMETIAFCEQDDKCRQVLSKHWPDVPQYNDVKTLTKEQLDNDGIEKPGLICGGFPCQPVSVAGKRKGKDDDRYLWGEYFRLISEIKPDWVIGENVAGLITMGIDDVLADLEGKGYAVQTFVIPACAVGAYHRRDRVWIVANANKFSNGKQYVNEEKRNNLQRNNNNVAESTIMQRNVSRKYCEQEKRQISKPRNNGSKESLANASGKGLQGRQEVRNTERGRAQRNQLSPRCGERSKPGNWLPEPPVGRVANGVSGRMDRLKQLGNAVIPQIPEVIGKAIMDIEAR